MGVAARRNRSILQGSYIFFQVDCKMIFSTPQQPARFLLIVSVVKCIFRENRKIIVPFQRCCSLLQRFQTENPIYRTCKKLYESI